MKLADIMNEVEQKEVDNKAKSQKNDEIKIYNSYIYFIG